MNIFQPSSEDISKPIAEASRSTSKASMGANRTEEQLISAAGVAPEVLEGFKQKLDEFITTTKLEARDIYELQFAITDSNGNRLSTVQIPINSTDKELTEQIARRTLIARFLGQIGSNPALAQSKDIVADVQFGYYRSIAIDSDTSASKVQQMSFWPDSSSIRGQDGGLLPGTAAEMFGIATELSSVSDVGLDPEMRAQRIRDNKNNQQDLDKGDQSRSAFAGVRIVSRSRNAPSWMPSVFESGVAIYEISATTSNGEKLSLNNITPTNLETFYKDLVAKGHLGAQLTIKYYGKNQNLNSDGARNQSVTFTIPGR